MEIRFRVDICFSIIKFFLITFPICSMFFFMFFCTFLPRRGCSENTPKWAMFSTADTDSFKELLTLNDGELHFYAVEKHLILSCNNVYHQHDRTTQNLVDIKWKK